MKAITTLLACLGSCISVLKAADEIDLKSCPEIGWHFKIAPYLDVAGSLQKDGKEKAVKHLRSWADSGQHEDQVIILCRMLFEPRKHQEFRRPLIGDPSFIGGSHWPLEPIAVHEGIPILVTYGYVLDEAAEPSRQYLQYCIDHCRWRAVPYTSHTPDELKKIIAQWLSEQKWPRPLDAREQDFFAGQAEAAPGEQPETQATHGVTATR
jgi:hypothetical protein